MTSPQPPAAPPAPAGSDDARLTALEGKVDQLLAAVGGGGQAHAAAQGAVQGRLAAPGDLTGQIQAELDRRDAATKQQEQAAATGSRLDALELAAAARGDKPPRSPVRRITRIMYGPADE